jgi:hypothetical protein
LTLEGGIAHVEHACGVLKLTMTGGEVEGKDGKEEDRGPHQNIHPAI